MCDMEDAYRDFRENTGNVIQPWHELDPRNFTLSELDELLGTVDFTDLEDTYTRLYNEEVARREKAEHDLASITQQIMIQAEAQRVFWSTLRNVSLALALALLIGTLLIYAWAGPLTHR